MNTINSLDDLEKVLVELKPAVGWLGGRYFTSQKISCTLHEIVSVFQSIVKTTQEKNRIAIARRIIIVVKILNRASEEVVYQSHSIFKSLNNVREVVENYWYTTLTTFKELKHTVKGPLLDEEVNLRLEKNSEYARYQQTRQTSRNFILHKPTTNIIINEVPKRIFFDFSDNVGVAWCEGRRPTMQDTHLITEMNFYAENCCQKALLLGVFDGHGKSATAAEFARDQLSKYLLTELESCLMRKITKAGIWIALKRALHKLDTAYPGKEGTTAVIAFIYKNRVWIANVGDSRAVTTFNKMQLSEDAKPEDKRYYNKILALGGSVTKCGQTFRVEGRVAIARTLGNKRVLSKEYKRVLSPIPKITSLEIVEKSYLILACDGLFDVASSQEIADAVLKMDEEYLQCKEMARRLVFSAITNGSNDNVTVLVVRI